MKTEPRHIKTELNAVKRSLQKEKSRREKAEESLKLLRAQYAQLSAESDQAQEQLRRLSRQILLAQEEERKHISRELHDEINQILTSINVRLTALKIENAANNSKLKKRISTTQRLVEKSVSEIHRFACELRPPMLDNLGLQAALLSLVRGFTDRTGIQAQLEDDTGGRGEELSGIVKTALYRVAQEAFTNISKHSRASQVVCSFQMQDGVISMNITDNGKSFDLEKALKSKRRNCLGIVGMRERVEMVGGTFTISSVSGEGSTVSARIPLEKKA